MPPQVEVFNIGTPVDVGNDIPGVVTAVTIRNRNHITYEVSWWDGRTHVSQWLESFQVSYRPGSTTARMIGFAPTGE